MPFDIKLSTFKIIIIYLIVEDSLNDEFNGITVCDLMRIFGSDLF